MFMSNCIFCKIVAGEIPNYTVYEDENVLAFLDVHPCSKGHTVVIPKGHVGELNEISEEAFMNLMSGLQKTILLVEKIIRPDGMNVGINNRAVAGQAVPHIHWHIIPRYEKDGGGSMHSIVRTQDAVDVGELAKLFK